MFSALYSRLKKSQAAVVIENVLTDVVKIRLEQTTPAIMANYLIQRVWESKPDIFDGKFGKRPHKITVAACALASGLECFDSSSTNRNALTLALGVVMNELNVNGGLYEVSTVDKTLIDFAANIFIEETDRLADSPLAQSLM